MPRSLILRTVSLALLYVILVFSLYMFFLGHNGPGGGFIAGLIAAAVILIQYLAFSRFNLDETFRRTFHRLIGFGLVVAGGSGLIGPLLGQSFLTGYHRGITLPGGMHLELSSVLLFDLGVYLLVIGAVISVFLALEEQRS